MNAERQSARYLSRQMRAAYAVLADPTASPVRRCGARRRLNHAVCVLRALAPVPPMKRRLQSDVLAEKEAAQWA